MRQLNRKVWLKGALTAIALLLLHTTVLSQEEEPVPPVVDTVVTVVDTSVIPGLDYTEDEELERAPAAPDTPVYRQIPDSVIRNLQRSKDFAYANDAEYWPKKEMPEEEGAADKKKSSSKRRGSWIDQLTGVSWFRYLIFAILIGVLLYTIIRIAVSNRLIMFKGTGPSISDEEHELMQENDLRGMIAGAEQEQQFRLAVRYRYMKLLKDLDERNIIQLDAKATNWDYVRKMGQHSLKKQFLLLTRAYEYAWYGEFEVSAEQYGFIRKEFEKMENSLY